MMKTLILICALGISRADCSTDNAVSVIQGPDARHAAECGFLGQAYLASTAMAGYLDGEHYLKMLCTRHNQQEAKAAPHEEGPRIADAIP